MNLLKTTFSPAFVLAGALLACGAAQAAPVCDSVSRVQRLIVERADDVEVLRAYVWRTSIIYGIDMIDVRENLEKWRAAVECRRQMAAADAPTVVVQR